MSENAIAFTIYGVGAFLTFIVCALIRRSDPDVIGPEDLFPLMALWFLGVAMLIVYVCIIIPCKHLWLWLSGDAKRARRALLEERARQYDIFVNER